MHAHAHTCVHAHTPIHTCLVSEKKINLKQIEEKREDRIIGKEIVFHTITFLLSDSSFQDRCWWGRFSELTEARQYVQEYGVSQTNEGYLE